MQAICIYDYGTVMYASSCLTTMKLTNLLKVLCSKPFLILSLYCSRLKQYLLTGQISTGLENFPFKLPLT